MLVATLLVATPLDAMPLDAMPLEVVPLLADDETRPELGPPLDAPPADDDDGEPELPLALPEDEVVPALAADVPEAALFELAEAAEEVVAAAEDAPDDGAEVVPLTEVAPPLLDEVVAPLEADAAREEPATPEDEPVPPEDEPLAPTAPEDEDPTTWPLDELVSSLGSDVVVHPRKVAEMHNNARAHPVHGFPRKTSGRPAERDGLERRFTEASQGKQLERLL